MTSLLIPRIIFLSLVLLFLQILKGEAQTLLIDWQRTFGGTGNDILQDIYPTADSNYILIGLTDSNNLDVSCELKGKHDIWVIKMDPLGNIIWQKCLGGTVEEGNPYTKIIQTSDGGYLFITESWSSDVDVVGHHLLSDAWTVKLDAFGNIMWAKSFGGSAWDVPRNLLELPGKRYLVMSRSTSSDGDVPVNIDTDPESFDAWVFIVDSAGEFLMNKVYGGTGDDDLYKPILMSDGNIALFGLTNSTDGDLTDQPVDTTDGWLLKIDTNGMILSSQVYGNINYESFLDAFATDDGGFIAFGETGDPVAPIDQGSYHANADWWAVKLDVAGNMEWQGVYGGSEDENFRRAAPVSDNSGYYMSGSSTSTDGDVNCPPSAGTNYYIVRLALDGALLSAIAPGGTKSDFCYAITPSGIAVGGTYSSNYDVLDFKGQADGWLIHLDFSTSILPEEKVDVISAYPNPANEFFVVKGIKSGYNLRLNNIMGKT
ncbi:MAG: hypothetical protein H0V61_03750, partial [Chitinophagales bacterium]|nr:hypothetical protein [Chitinophagales bacterium]